MDAPESSKTAYPIRPAEKEKGRATNGTADSSKRKASVGLSDGRADKKQKVDDEDEGELALCLWRSTRF